MHIHIPQKPIKFLRSLKHLSGMTTAVMLCLVGTSAQAAFDVPASTRSISSSQWRDFIRRAHANNGDGIVNLPARRITAEPCTITTNGTIIRGAGRGRTTLVGADGQRAMFIVQANNAAVQQMQITGARPIILTELTRPGSRFLRGRPTLSQGMNNGISIRRGFSNFRLTDAFLRDVNVGIEFEQHSLPHGLVVRRVDFSVGSGMIICTARRDTRERQGDRLNRRMLLDRLRHVNRDGQLSDNNRNMGIRGLTFDFGNNRDRPNLLPVDMNGSVISNCNFIRTGKWNIDLNRASNIVIENNVFNGGGWENDNFTHTLHFEDAGDTSRPIVIRNNTIRQRRRSNNGTVITGAVTPAHIWLGNTAASRSPALRINNNTYGGVSNSLLLVKQNAGFDDIDRDVRRPVPSTVGGDVPANQQGRRRGPANRR